MGLDYASLALELGIRGRESNNQLVARCPIHRDRRPSFSLNTSTGLWICYSQCGGGNFVQLVQRCLGLNYRQARAWLLEREALPPEPPPAQPTPTDIPLWLAHWHQASNATMPHWILDRGFTWETINRWDMRWHEATQQLLIPVYWHGELLGTITRNLRSGPKYTNSPGLPGKEILFGLHNTGSMPRVAGKLILILVEGPLDCIWLEQHRLPAAALLGLHLTQHHVRLLHSFEEIVLCMDADAPGRDALKRHAGELAKWRPLASITTIAYPEGAKDVQDMTQEQIHQALAERHLV